ncbi:MAG: hypothetical protein AUI15_14060 [Actinobacteria bacterium 13_2_20CM_2_66_6]|nr:MAG: hypothetical protein AUI15_14060 [Actinobacteria bacterium 13_2_20CM_2_66_6]
MPQKDVVVVGEEPDRRVDLPRGSRSSRQVEELLAPLIVEHLELRPQALERRPQREAGPRAEIGG